MQKTRTCKDCRDALLVAGKLSRRGPCPQLGWPARQAQVGRRSATQHTWSLGKLYENSQVVRPRTPSVANPGNHDRLGFNVRTVLLQGMSFDGRQNLANFSESCCSGPLRSQATLRSLVMLLLRPRQSTTTRWTYFAKVCSFCPQNSFCFVVAKLVWLTLLFGLARYEASKGNLFVRTRNAGRPRV